MKKQLTILLMLVSVMFGYSVLAEQAHADTNVSGIINTDTTWTLANSPYFITDTVQIPSDVTLTIEPGVIINKPTDGDMFLLSGAIYAHGTIDNKIIFDGGSNSNFFNVTGYGNAFLDLKYCTIKNGLMFWPGGNRSGHFYLQYSELTNLAEQSTIWFPTDNIDISYNKFIDTYGFRIYTDNNIKVDIKNNFFYKGHSISNTGYWNFYIIVESQDLSEVTIKYNSFIDMTDIVLKLGSDSINTFSASKNYWNTQDMNAINSMIYDKNDNISVENYISYLPILTEPHPDTPTVTPCASSTHSNWSECVNGQQTRIIISSSPENCLEGNPVLNQSCQVETNNEDNIETVAQPETEAATQPEPETSESNSEEISTIIISDGDIIQCQNSSNPSAVYIVKIIGDTKYIRHIVSLEIFNYYSHLKWKNLKQVNFLNNYSLSGWVRYNTGPNNISTPTDKVYEINSDQTRHWINMTADDFLTHGGSEPAIFNINQGELNLYIAGANVMSL